jgi:putative sigma-54 modulation protein
MQVHYTERYAKISDAEKKKAARKFAKIHRILSAHRDLEAHVVFSKNGADVEAEVTLHALQHTLVVTDRNGDAFTALNHALTKLEKQALKNKVKLIETRRPSRQSGDLSPAVAAVLPKAPPEKPNGARVVAAAKMVSKPLTVEEARIVLEQKDRDQITFRDMESGRTCVLLRRRDGDLELIEMKA